ncbi:hypothetical protein HDU93_008223 [Gonapodya sp. JEL0774]|nr:hypothetical protein HDU93_008223 [Gonapodya sp. JEL0774]
MKALVTGLKHVADEAQSPKLFAFAHSAENMDAEIDDVGPELFRRGSKSQKRSLSRNSSPGTPGESPPELTSDRLFKAPKTPTTKITLNFLLLGEKNPFEVRITPTASVNSLKEAIKAKMSRTLSDVDAYQLDLWKVNISYAARASITEDSLKEADVMGALDEISEYFQEPPAKKHIHVVVRRPQGLFSLCLDLP